MVSQYCVMQWQNGCLKTSYLITTDMQIGVMVFKFWLFLTPYLEVT